MNNIEKILNQYCKKFGLCKEKGTCQCKKELKFIENAINQAVAEERERVVRSLVFRDVEYTSLDRMSQVSRDNYFYNLSLQKVKDDILTSLQDLNKINETIK